MADLTLDGAMLIYRTPYHPALVAALKAAIPAAERRWDPARKAWLVAPSHGPALARITRQYLGQDVQVPLPVAAATPLETRFLDVRYLGTTKDRGDGGDRTAFAWIGGEWAAVFPEKVLRQWFGEEDLAPAGQAVPPPPQDTTLYAVLGIARGVDPDAVRKAYRRLARQWHPDVCREPGAHEMFIRVQRAYEVLGDAGKRARYDAGLALAAAAEDTRRRTREFAEQSAARWAALLADAVNGYRAPLRCGWLLAEGREVLGRFVVEKIVAWEDIVNEAGKVLVASWPAGSESPEERWVWV